MPGLRRLAFTALFALPSLAGAAPVRLALIEDESSTVMVRLDEAVERVLREAGPDAAVLNLAVVHCEIGGPDVRCRLPAGASAEGMPGGAAVALEDESGVTFTYPPQRDFVEALKAAAADPASYFSPFSLSLDEHEAVADVKAAPRGGASVFLRARLGRPLGLRRRSTLAVYYRVRWRGQELSVLAVGRIFGGIGRVATAGLRWSENGAWIGVARGGAFGGAGSDAAGARLVEALERAGLRYSAVAAAEMENWQALKRYRQDNPDGVRFLSVNIVLSSAPAQSALPRYEVVEASGARLALVGLTSAKSTLSMSELKRDGLSVLDPAAELKKAMPELRSRADIVVALADLSAEENARLAQVLGLDLILGVDAAYFQFADAATTHVERDRPEYANPFPPLRAHSPALDQIEIERSPPRGRANWRIAHTTRLLDDAVPETEGFPEFPFERYATGFSSAPTILPSAGAVLGSINGVPAYRSRQFWTLAAAMLAEQTGAEAALLPVSPLAMLCVGDVSEDYARSWLSRSGSVVMLELSGARLKSLADEAAEQARLEMLGLPPGARPRFTVSGFDERGRVRGSLLETNEIYRVSSSRAAADALDLGEPGDPGPGAREVSDSVMAELRARRQARPQDYRAWIEGRPISEPGLWKINFRDVGLNLRQTRISRADAFDSVPNSRIQGFDELLIGGVFKADTEYLKRALKWTNTLEAEYARSRITPRNAPQTTNIAANRIMLLTLGTRRAGAIRREWLARSWGPSVGVQYDGEFEAALGRKRKQVYSLFPGVEFFDGTFIRSLELSGIVKRDLSREPPNTQTGLRLRSVFSREIGPARALLQGELWNNYFFLTKHDAAGDLRMEGDFNVKLRVPIRKHLSVAPFLDYYWFALKTRPLWGYSATLGVSIGFSRLWKPQYEDF